MLRSRAKGSVSAFVKRENGFFAWAEQQIRRTFALPPTVQDSEVWKSNAKSVDGDELWRLYKSVQLLQGEKKIHPSDLIDRYHVLAKTLDPEDFLYNTQRLAGACNRVMLFTGQVPKSEAKEICNDVMSRLSQLGVDSLLEAVTFRTENRMFVDDEMFATAIWILCVHNNKMQLKASAKTGRVDLHVPEDALIKLQKQYGLPVLMVRKEARDERNKRTLEFLWKLLAMRYESLRTKHLSSIELKSILCTFSKCEVRASIMFDFLARQGKDKQKEWDLISQVLQQCNTDRVPRLAFKICCDLFHDGQAICLNPSVSMEAKVKLSREAVVAYQHMLQSIGSIGKQRKNGEGRAVSKLESIREIKRMVSVDERLKFGTTNEDVMDLLLPDFALAESFCLPHAQQDLDEDVRLIRSKHLDLSLAKLKAVIKAHSFTSQFLELLPWIEENFPDLLESNPIKSSLISGHISFLRNFPDVDTSKVPVEKVEGFYEDVCNTHSRRVKQTTFEHMCLFYYLLGDEEKVDAFIASQPNLEVTEYVFNGKMACCIRKKQYDRVIQVFADMQSNGIQPDGLSVELLVKSFVLPALLSGGREYLSEEQLDTLRRNTAEAVANLLAVSRNYPNFRATEKTFFLLLSACNASDNNEERDRVLKFAQKFNVQHVIERPDNAERLSELSSRRR